MMSTIQLRIAVVLALAAGGLTASAQQRPPSADKYPPNPPANHVEVRFALGKEAVTCKRFKLTVKGRERTILSGSFTSSFSTPPTALTSPDKLDITLQCGEHKWHFPEVLPQAFQQGWWWVGTDYPPFQENFQEDERFKDALWIKYLTADPIGAEPFSVYKFCPASLKDQKRGPCNTD